MKKVKIGRPANEGGLKATEKLLKKTPNLSDRMIATLIEPALGYKPDPKSVWRWRKMVNS